MTGDMIPRDGQWHHVVVVSDGATERVHIGGEAA